MESRPDCVSTIGIDTRKSSLAKPQRAQRTPRSYRPQRLGIIRVISLAGANLDVRKIDLYVDGAEGALGIGTGGIGGIPQNILRVDFTGHVANGFEDRIGERRGVAA